MAGLFGISVDPSIYDGKMFLNDLFWGTFYHQHRREEYGGLSTYNQRRESSIITRTHRGLFRPNFNNDLIGLEGTEGIGCCSPVREPLEIGSRLGRFSICFSGNIINSQQLVGDFKRFGYLVRSSDDVEILAMLIVQGKDFVDGIKKATEQIEGAFSVLILTEDGIIYAACSPTGCWPLIIGQKDGVVGVASESTSFENLDLMPQRDLEPGEIITIKNGCWEKQGQTPTDRVQICSFLWVYTAFPASIIMGVSVSGARERMGALLAKNDIKDGFTPDIVTYVPDSGRDHGLGYQGEFCDQVNAGKIKRVPQLRELLRKYSPMGRSFTPLLQSTRDTEAFYKLIPSGERFRGGIAVLADDSIVRGTQSMKNTIPKVRKTGVKEVHMRISCPPLMSFCPWGKSTLQGEMFARNIPEEQRAKAIGSDSLKHNTKDELVEAIGLPRDKLCIDCCLP